MNENHDYELSDINDDEVEKPRNIEKNKSDKNDKLNDIVITQCILCLILALGMLILNIFYPDISRELIERYKHYSGTSENEVITNMLSRAVQTFGNFSQ